MVGVLLQQWPMQGSKTQLKTIPPIEGVEDLLWLKPSITKLSGLGAFVQIFSLFQPQTCQSHFVIV